MPDTSALPELNYTIITPYLLPPGTSKKVNVGDGFILDSAIKLLGGRPSNIFSSRRQLNGTDIDRINSTRCVVVAGANTLKDDFEITPGFTRATLAAIKVPLVLMGIGHYGIAEVTRGLRPESIRLIRSILERFPSISVRCDASRQYLLASLPDCASNVMMTSCPVAHSVDGADFGFVRKPLYRQLVVTITDRALLPQQLPLLPVAKSLFPAERRILALHQDYGNAALPRFAADHGYETFCSQHYEAYLDLYRATDIHCGNRVHAHLKCLSLGIPSFLTPFDLRQLFFSQSLDFPLVAQLPNPEIQTYDFERFAIRQRASRQVMDAFVKSVRSIIGGS